jgi:type IV secretion system protein VirB9
MKRWLLAAMCILAPLPALAVADPTPGPRDSRVRVINYDSLQMVRLCSTGLTPITIVLEEGEHPGVIGGLMVSTNKDDAPDWYLSGSGSMITLQPMHKMKSSVLTIGGITAGKQLRPYQIELCTRDGDITDQNDREAYMMVQFRYQAPQAPADPTAVSAAQARREAARQAAEDREARARLATALTATPRNYAYDKRDPAGCPLLAPSYVYDDGLRTTLTFPPHATVPAVLVLNQDGKEAVQTAITSDTADGLEVMLPSVYRYIRLRRGGKVCELRNNAFDPVGRQPGGGTGTVSPDVALQARR